MRSLPRSIAVVAVLLLAGCSAGGDASTSEPASDVGGVESQESAADEAAAPAEDRGVDAGTGTDVNLSNQEFVVSGSLSMTVEDPHAVAEQAALLVERVGGKVQERNEQVSAEAEATSVYLVVRIPSDQVTVTLADLEELGTVQDLSLVTTEVTAQARDLDARIRALEISIARLEDLLGRAGSITEIVNAEQVLTDRQVELESVQAQKTALAEQIAMSTIRLELWTEATAPEPEPEPGFWGGLVSGWNALVGTTRDVLHVVGVLLPWLAAGALLTAVIIYVGRWLGRRQAAKAPSAAPSGPTTSLPWDARRGAARPAYPSGYAGQGPMDARPVPQPPAAPAAPEPAPAPPAPTEPAPTEPAPTAPGAVARRTKRSPTPPG
ncbi:DUF4349 domain-containing protein [Cellulomonas sp. KRMCY2]|uniref:DUF4349 domain-containing protein n=1 Tax=Cellulomonas sp. KRMCY2 TaxID=1304865 RepID=UPI00045E8C07|nr:DUF4349 domain-containing protein [Cellulomonas sp. KRMCY2]